MDFTEEQLKWLDGLRKELSLEDFTKCLWELYDRGFWDGRDLEEDKDFEDAVLYAFHQQKD